MTSSHETERVYSYNPRPTRGMDHSESLQSLWWFIMVISLFLQPRTHTGHGPLRITAVPMVLYNGNQWVHVQSAHCTTFSRSIHLQYGTDLKLGPLPVPHPMVWLENESVGKISLHTMLYCTKFGCLLSNGEDAYGRQTDTETDTDGQTN